MGEVTAAACARIHHEYPGIERFFLESDLATDTKSSQVNMCGELSLGSAIVAEEWVAAHDLYRCNR